MLWFLAAALMLGKAVILSGDMPSEVGYEMIIVFFMGVKIFGIVKKNKHFF